MKKMNRSQSSYRQQKSVIHDDGDSWVSRVPTKQQSKTNMVNSFLEDNKENNSLFQSISERNFTKADIQGADSVVQQLRDKCRRLEQQLNRQFVSEGASSNYAYSQKYYMKEIEDLRSALKQKDKELEYYQMEKSSRNDEIESINSDFSSRFDKEQRDKNLYIKEINQKSIEITHLHERIKYQKAEIETLKLCFEDREKTIKSLQERVGQADMKKKKIQYYEGQLRDREQCLRQLETKALQIKKETQLKDSLIRDKSRNMEQLEKTIDSYDDKLKSMEQSLLRIREEKKSIQERHEQAFRQCQEWKQSYEDLLQQNDGHHEIQLKLKTYQNLVEDLKRKCNELTSSNQKLRIGSSCHQKVAARLQQTEKEAAQLRKDFQNREQRIYELQAKEKAYRHLEECHEKAKKEKDDFFLRLQEKNKQAKMLASLLEESQLRVAELEEELGQLGQSTVKAREKEDKMDSLLRDNSRLNGIIQEKVSEMEKLHLKVSSLQSKLSDKHLQHQRMRAAFDQKEQEVDEVNLQVENLRERLALQSSNRNMEQQKVLKCTQEILTLKAVLTKTEGQLQQLRVEFQEANESHRQEVNSFKDSFADMEIQREKAHKVLLEYKEQTEVLRKQIENQKQEVQEGFKKEKEHKEKISRIESEIIQLTNLNSQLRAQKAQIISKCSQLKSIYEFVEAFKEEN